MLDTICSLKHIYFISVPRKICRKVVEGKLSARGEQEDDIDGRDVPVLQNVSRLAVVDSSQLQYRVAKAKFYNCRLVVRRRNRKYFETNLNPRNSNDSSENTMT